MGWAALIVGSSLILYSWAVILAEITYDAFCSQGPPVEKRPIVLKTVRDRRQPRTCLTQGIQSFHTNRSLRNVA